MDNSSEASPSAPSSASDMDRRTFVKAAAAAGAGLVLLSSRPGFASDVLSRRRRYVHVGLGSRARMYQEAIQKTYRDSTEMVGLCDLNPGRLELARQRCAANGATVPPGYVAADFDRMLRETKPDVVIVTTVDGTHHDYIVRSLEAGCDVITEKPMTTNAAKCQLILDAVKRTGRHCRVAFNYRYTPSRTQVKELLMGGAIGDILSADFNWLLNTNHGTDYFRRWHSHKENSGGLMIHKATHHFDLVNWWLGAVPETVHAAGKRDFYTPVMAKRLGLQGHHERCHTCPEQKRCGFFLDLAADAALKELYLDQEHYDGYFRDRCVFRPDIDIEDTMNVIVKYDTGATLSYSLNAFNAWEGYMIAFNGTKGRLEHSIVEQVYAVDAASAHPVIKAGGITTRIVPMRGAAHTIVPREGPGGHWGGDPVMLEDLFLPNPPTDACLRASDEHGGAWSCLIGAAANISFATGQPVRVAGLVTGLLRPPTAPMPSPEAPVPMPLPVATQEG
jgi:predicted dehydrogenase